MKRLILVSVLAFSGAANAAEKLDFTDSSFAAQLTAPAVTPEVAEVPAPARARAGHYVQVSGYVNLNGNGWMPGPDGGFTSVTLNGYGTFSGAEGVTSNNTYINTSVSLWVRPNQYVFQTVWPSVYATFYKNGKIVGSTNMTGSISVSGWPSSNFFSLSGSGYLSGSIYVEDAP
ncbi:MAG: hypothetical protein HY952_02735 [Elusimicrobia bacterium]|nr:hypothetical protein [Elusimicrobiota bacterium]